MILFWATLLVAFVVSFQGCSPEKPMLPQPATHIPVHIPWSSQIGGSDPHGLFRYAGPGPFIGEQGLIVLAFGEYALIDLMYMGSLDRKSIFVEARNISYKVLHEEIIVDLSGIPFWTRSIMEVANITYATAATIRLTFPYPFNGTTMELQRLPK
ncbi:hypothetical protein FOZ63_031232 [Perkinsus olseni]|uniref:Uncharacterized protein n=1 Tax=Perkinsus olseni TaxID=32597 RepID=A0A7J6PYR1_PEROL|nr:hypothetical protein FOZ63_031232 [Perkinsus olseni]